MKILKVIVDKKPSDCIGCPLVRLKICGKGYKKMVSSGAAYFGLKPDKRCLLKLK